MHLWIDGDACPKQVKQILFRAAMKRKIPLFIVANQWMHTPSSPFIQRVLVESGFDGADKYIVQHIKNNDLVVTSDILLAELILQKGAFALSPRGHLFTDNHIKQMVSMRNINESLRGAGLIQGGPAPLHQREILAFSNQLDQWITRLF